MAPGGKKKNWKKMKIFMKVLLVLMSLLSIAAGIPKIMKMPNEMEFLQGVGFAPNMVVSLGLAQVIAGVLFILPKTRLFGGILVALTLAVSAATLFMAGKTNFGLFSILPIVLTGIVIIDNIKSKKMTLT